MLTYVIPVQNPYLGVDLGRGLILSCGAFGLSVHAIHIDTAEDALEEKNGFSIAFFWFHDDH